MVDNVDAFGFLNPVDVLHGCHIISAFLGGQVVDRDMVICYHWGHGMGHIYAFGANSDVVDAPLDEIKEQENNTTRQEVGGEDEDSLLGKDDMVLLACFFLVHQHPLPPP